uniref:Ubiquitin fusion degradation protein 1 homolog n=1 Tax=Panagrellus redivivus TaxID=6233 RepID=A0A7E4UU85_PANRE
MFFENLLHHPTNFECRLRAFPAVFFQNADQKKIKEINYGGKILLPNSVLDQLVRLNIQYPMLFKLTNMTTQRVTHCGVLEFLAEEGKCFLPQWMMDQLHLSEGTHVSIQYVSLPSATYARFKPMSTDFLQVTNPRAMLEIELRKFACLTKNDIIAVEYNGQLFEFKVNELKPKNAVTIIECDMNVEFDAPEGYVEPDYKTKNEMPEAPAPKLVTPANPFAEGGYRLDGKKKPRSPYVSESQEVDPHAIEGLQLGPIVPDFDYKPGKLVFPRYNYKSRVVMEKELAEKQAGPTSSFQSFSGAGYTIRSKR